MTSSTTLLVTGGDESRGMDERRTEAAASDSPVSLRGLQAPRRPSPQSGREPLTSDGGKGKEEKQESVSGIRPARSSCLSEEISGGEAEGGRRGITGLTGGSRPVQPNGKWKLGKIKARHSLYWRDQR